MSTLSTFSLPKRLLFFFIWLFMLVLAKTLGIGNDETAHRFLSGEIFKQNNGKFFSIILAQRFAS